MAKFDVVEAAASGYRYAWQERRAILSLALIPLFVKIGCFAAITLLGLDYNVLRQGLILLPAYFMEGFVVIVVIRMAMFGERYNQLLEMGNTATLGENQRQAIMAGVVIYVLTKLVSYMLSGSLMAAKQIDQQLQSTVMPEPQGSPFVMTLLILMFMIYAFRFFWLYAPVAMNVTVTQFLTIIRSFTSSLYLIAMWMLCTIPLFVVLLGVARLLMLVFPDIAPGQNSPIYTVLITPLRALTELAIALVCGLAMAYGLRSMMSGNKFKGFF